MAEASNGKLYVIGGTADDVTATGLVEEATVSIVDTTPPTLNCGSSDGLWHAGDVSVQCTAQDSGAGLANPADANFTLSTNVPAGTETANASTNTRQVCDLAGNCASMVASGFRVDKKAPAFNCAAADGLWHASDVSLWIRWRRL
jgi:hypothetical protein